ncbi:peptide ABC transporter ATP-binding protein [Megasphaera cerevisiae DSM 20462]|jgi:oligopeptide transport system ATP-binding protein|uniref:Peptide ABC transporter ATP-binding protein n=1 Tax=Megasphaera cerevisiae DSM 20462 TaxID=1122219 RepID=A0A0J6WVG3_9FIRM|nr:ATP-binding cassette domain-containing protein [Megasphaera cerevisiae]KMO86544.1 peptide ABC transporter ATP-binding protein [Megasphaera cerevisiae DSM 20462]OKY53766.1 peptide ABC transporter ATP-binding protein [Megasphaera cerevisiae]SJZ89954.1 oligopeptide transport system ATP-binding protein [Megasphaera cerevisiae DSM 20462]
MAGAVEGAAKKEEILTVRNLHKIFNARKKSEVRAVDDVSFTIYKGETFGLVGESGSGKSTTGRVVIKLDDITSGTVIYKGEDITHIKKKSELLSFRQSMQMIFQDPFASLNPRIPVKKILGDALRIHGICKTEQEVSKRVFELLDTVGINRAYVNRYPTEFSGGQCQRIGIARALCVNPDFIIADECLSALDVSIQAQIVNLLIQLQKEQGMTYLFIAHDLAMVKYISDRIGVMKDGKILEMAPANELYSHPLHPYTISLLSASPLTDLIAERQRQRIDYDPAYHQYPEGTDPKMHEIAPGHFVYCLEEEVSKYKQQLA